ncbi:hypothetical protein JVU11DRAFT_8623 [Chiua virens]|nr:hypothetical protein JVU11DRAFT_8623 [Chiua virens]
MGANPRKEESARSPDQTQNKDRAGNAPLRLWVGERFLGLTKDAAAELFKRSGKDNRVQKQEMFNADYRAAVNDLGRIVLDFAE